MTISISRAVSVGALALSASLLLAACGGAAVPTIPPVASPPAGSESVPSQPAADPTPVGGSETPGTRIVALNVQFNPAAVTVPAGEPLTIMFDNQDAGIPHDLAIKDGNGNQIALTAIITGPAQAQLALGPLEPGAYEFVCTVHPNMTGTITAE
jgi:plastocyanin